MRSLLIAAALATASGKIQKSHNAELIENEWIVVLKDNTTKADRANHMAMLGQHKVLFTYDNVFNGYAVQASELDMERISEHPDVSYVEQNGVVRAFQQCDNGPANPPAGLWGLSRVSYPTNWNGRPLRYTSGSQGADIYILDTGLNYDHVDFQGRARRDRADVFDSINENADASDLNGHGTHCGGTAGGSLYGVSKQAAIFNGKVLNRQGSGSFAGVTAGIDWVTGRTGARIASLSLGGGLNQPTNDAVTRLSQRPDALVSIASGNGNANACNTSPASAPGALTVNAIQNNDARAAFSNWGTCTHVFAPGVSVLSGWIGSATATNTISGTSMACPHVTGILSDMWQNRGEVANAVRARFNQNAHPNVVTNPGTGSPNLLAQSICRAA